MEQSHQQNANSTSCSKEDELLLSFQDTEMYLFGKVSGHNEEKRTRKERDGTAKGKKRMEEETA